MNAYLDNKLDVARKYVKVRYDFYNDEFNTSAYDYEHSDAIKNTIDGIRNKLLVSHFINAKNVEEYFTKNFLNKIIKSCLINGCAFARVVKNSEGVIELIPYDAYFATGTLDTDNTLINGLTIDKTDEDGNFLEKTYYYKDRIEKYVEGQVTTINNDIEVINLVPIIINQNALKPFGSSFITKKMMSDTRKLIKTKKRANKIQESLSNANTFISGVSQDFKKDQDEKTLRLVKDVIFLSQDADGNSPTITTRENGNTQLEEKIKDLENSIKYEHTDSSYSDMIESIRQDLIDAFNILANVIMKNVNNDKNSKLNGKIDIVFKNNDFSNFSPFMDGVLKINQVLPNYLGKDQLDKILGINGNKSKLQEAILGNIKKEIENPNSEVDEV